MDEDALLALFDDVAGAIRAALDDIEDWTLAGTRAGQYLCDIVADEAAVPILHGAGVGVLSEESGLHHEGEELIVVIDPVDGSTNASRRIPWYATSLCAVDEHGPRAALVVNQATDERFRAVRGAGAQWDAGPLRPSACTRVDDALIALSGYPPRHLGWRQMRALGAAALDLCGVAAGRVDGFVDCVSDASAPWDYLGGLLICREAGAAIADANGREMVVRDGNARRTPVAAATEELLDQLVELRTTFGQRREMD